MVAQDHPADKEPVLPLTYTGGGRRTPDPCLPTGTASAGHPEDIPGVPKPRHSGHGPVGDGTGRNPAKSSRPATLCPTRPRVYIWRRRIRLAAYVTRLERVRESHPTGVQIPYPPPCKNPGSLNRGFSFSADPLLHIPSVVSARQLPRRWCCDRPAPGRAPTGAVIRLRTRRSPRQHPHQHASASGSTESAGRVVKKPERPKNREQSGTQKSHGPRKDRGSCDKESEQKTTHRR